MSTYLYLVCVAHEPPLQAQEESGQHLRDLPQIRADIANREQIVAGWSVDCYIPGYFRRHTARFLAAHPRCPLAIVDEYGRRHPTTEPEGK